MPAERGNTRNNRPSSCVYIRVAHFRAPAAGVFVLCCLLFSLALCKHTRPPPIHISYLCQALS